MMNKELLMRNSIKTKEDLNYLLTPPPSHSIQLQIELLGVGKRTTIYKDLSKLSPFRDICRFLLSNDPAMIIISNEFQKKFPIQSKSGGKVIYYWKPSFDSYETIKKEMKDRLNINVTNENIDTMILGPTGNCIMTYHRIRINGVTFSTNKYERLSRVTRKYIYYKNSDSKRAEALNEGRAVARIENIYHVISHNVQHASTSYKLVQVTNFSYIEKKHESKLPQVHALSPLKNQYDMPIIDAKDILPVNIALWPASLKSQQTFLVVHTNPAFV